MRHLVKSLDIETIRRHQIDLKLLVKRIFTKQQLTLFRYQRDRLLAKKESTGLSSPDEMQKALITKDHLGVLNKFVPVCDLDKRLFRGVLLRDDQNLHKTRSSQHFGSTEHHQQSHTAESVISGQYRHEETLSCQIHPERHRIKNITHSKPLPQIHYYKPRFSVVSDIQ